MIKQSLFLITASLISFALHAHKEIKMQGIVPSESALDLLMEGNQRFISGNLLNPDQDVAVRQSLVNGQAPFATIVGCSDSRVPPEVIFDRGLGDLFVARTAGSVIDGVQMDSVEYSVNHIKSNLVVVLGHQNCGAVQGVIEKSNFAAGDIEYLIPYIEPAVEAAKKMSGDLLLNATKIHTQNMADSIKNSPNLKAAIDSGKLKVVAGYYSLETGKVEILED